MGLPSWLYGGFPNPDADPVKVASGGAAPFFGNPAAKAKPTEASALWDRVFQSQGEVIEQPPQPDTSHSLKGVPIRQLQVIDAPVSLGGAAIVEPKNVEREATPSIRPDMALFGKG